jgi:hypothetical protein
MKALQILFLLFLLLGGGAFFYLKVTRPILPVQRVIVNSSGKSLDVLVQGKVGNTLYVDRVADGGRFEIQIPTLSLQDRLFAMRLEEGAPPALPKEEKLVDSYIASRTKQITELSKKLVLYQNEVASNTLNSIMDNQRMAQIADLETEIKKLQISIENYKYRVRAN